jgi:hypothetical protein
MGLMYIIRNDGRRRFISTMAFRMSCARFDPSLSSRIQYREGPIEDEALASLENGRMHRIAFCKMRRHITLVASDAHVAPRKFSSNGGGQGERPVRDPIFLGIVTANNARCCR